MNFFLSVVLFLLMLLIGGKRGVKSLLVLALNVFITIFFIFLIACGLNAVITGLICCVSVSALTLFGTNSSNKKTISAFIAVVIVLFLMLFLILIVSRFTNIQGFSSEDIEEVSYYSANIGISMIDISSVVLLMGFIGAITDIAIAVVSSLNEIYENNKNISKKQLFKKSLNIGNDILGTSVNTLFFAYLGSFMALVIWFMKYNYRFSEILNSKLFAQEVVQMLCGGIGCVIIIPISSVIFLYFLKSKSIEIKS